MTRRLTRAAWPVGCCLAGLATFARQANAQNADRPEFLMVVLGDSYAAGEGVPETDGNHIGAGYVPAPAETWWNLPSDSLDSDALRCHRSPRSPGAVAAESLQARFPEVRITLVSFACSGAEVFSGVLGPYIGREPSMRNDPALAAQVLQVNQRFRDEARRIDALLLNIGGNDVGFAGIVFRCLIVPDGVVETDLPEVFVGCDEDGALRSDVETRISSLAAKYARIDDALNGRGIEPKLDTLLKPRRVYVTEYPDPSHKGDEFCTGEETDDPIYRGGTEPEARFIFERVVTPMNAAIARAAGQARPTWTYVGGIAEAFRSRGICTADPFFNFNDAALRRQGADVDAVAVPIPFVGNWYPTVPLAGGVAHPSAAGYRAIAERIAAAVEPQLTERFRYTAAPILSIDDVVEARPGAVLAGGRMSSTVDRGAVRRSGAAVAVTRSAAGVAVRWTIPSGYELPPDSIAVDLGESQRVWLPGDADRYTVTARGRFRVTVRACNRFGCSPASNEVVVSTVVPGVPTALHRSASPASGQVAGTIPVGWTAADDYQLHFEVHYRPADQRRPEYTVIAAGGSPATIGSLRSPLPSGSYEVKVRACSQVGCSGFSEAIVESTRSAPSLIDVPSRPRPTRPLPREPARDRSPT